jgi:ribonuclease HI
MILLVCVPGHMGVDINEIADHLAREVIMDWTSGKHEHRWQSLN